MKVARIKRSISVNFDDMFQHFFNKLLKNKKQGKFELNATIGIEAVLVKMDTTMTNRFSKNIIVVCS